MSIQKNKICRYKEASDRYLRAVYNWFMYCHVTDPTLRMLYFHNIGRHEIGNLRLLYDIYHLRVQQKFYKANTGGQSSAYMEVAYPFYSGYADRMKKLQRRIDRLEAMAEIHPFVNNVLDIQTHFGESLENYLEILRFNAKNLSLIYTPMQKSVCSKAINLLLQGRHKELSTLRNRCQQRKDAFLSEISATPVWRLDQLIAQIEEATLEAISLRKIQKSVFPCSLEEKINDKTWCKVRRRVLRQQRRRLTALRSQVLAESIKTGCYN